tara:strand:- start:46 stop:261 length:216 start_codon:yes stop_codon:yes gene_type:complete
MTIEIIEVLLALVLLVMVIYLNKTYEKRIKQIKSDYYTKGYNQGCNDTLDKTTKVIRDFNKNNSVDKNEES